MIRFRALDRYKRYYLHAIRNGKGSEKSADEAMTRTKAEIHQWFEADKSLDEFRKRELWGDIFSILIAWQSLLDDVVPTADPKALALKVNSLDESEEAVKQRELQQRDSHDSDKLGTLSDDNPSGGGTDSGAECGDSASEKE